jgi:hypothetical protein
MPFARRLDHALAIPFPASTQAHEKWLPHPEESLQNLVRLFFDPNKPAITENQEQFSYLNHIFSEIIKALRDFKSGKDIDFSKFFIHLEMYFFGSTIPKAAHLAYREQRLLIYELYLCYVEFLVKNIHDSHTVKSWLFLEKNKKSKTENLSPLQFYIANLLKIRTLYQQLEPHIIFCQQVICLRDLPRLMLNLLNLSKLNIYCTSEEKLSIYIFMLLQQLYIRLNLLVNSGNRNIQNLKTIEKLAKQLLKIIQLFITCCRVYIFSHVQYAHDFYTQLEQECGERSPSLNFMGQINTHNLMYYFLCEIISSQAAILHKNTYYVLSCGHLSFDKMSRVCRVCRLQSTYPVKVYNTTNGKCAQCKNTLFVYTKFNEDHIEYPSICCNKCLELICDNCDYSRQHWHCTNQKTSIKNIYADLSIIDKVYLHPNIVTYENGIHTTTLKKYWPDNECVVCLINLATIIFLPCGHLKCCAVCAKGIKERNNQCPICRKKVHNMLFYNIDTSINNTGVKCKNKGCRNTELNSINVPCGHSYHCYTCAKEFFDASQKPFCECGCPTVHVARVFIGGTHN